MNSLNNYQYLDDIIYIDYNDNTENEKTEELSFDEIIQCSNDFNKYITTNNININDKEQDKQVSDFFKEKGNKFNKKLSKTLNKIVQKHIPKKINILILGVAGRGKSTLLNNLFNTNFAIKKFGRGTEATTTSSVNFGGLNIYIIDTVGLGDIQSGKEEIDFSYNNEILLEYLKKEEICCIFQVFDFTKNRDLKEDEIQIINFLETIDFNSPNYIDIINSYNIVFTKANTYIDDDSIDNENDIDENDENITIRDKKENIDGIASEFNDFSDSEKELKLKEMDKLINGINESYQEKYEYNINSIKNIIRKYLEKKIKCTNKYSKIENIINSIKFSYAGDADKRTKKINHIPLLSKNFNKNIQKKIKAFKPEYTYKVWNINWRHQIFENLLLSCGSKNAVAIDKAVKNICNIKVQKNLDTTSTKMDKINENDFIKQNDKIKKIIKKGKKEIWKEALGSALGGSASAGAYAFGIITGGPAILLGGFLAFVGWKTGSYFNNDKEKTD